MNLGNRGAHSIGALGQGTKPVVLSNCSQLVVHPQTQNSGGALAQTETLIASSTCPRMQPPQVELTSERTASVRVSTESLEEEIAYSNVQIPTQTIKDHEESGKHVTIKRN